MPERDELLSVVRAMAARLPVDWTELEASASDESLRAAIRELRVIADIAELHHTLPETSSTPQLTPTSDLSTNGGHRPSTTLEAADRQPATWGSFTLLERIGHGSFGEVYRARDTRLDREVALKLLRPVDTGPTTPSSVAIDEGTLLARIRHPNVVTVYGADRIDDTVGIWMEFIHGATLEHELRETGPFPVAGAIEAGIQICGALAAVHEAGLLHRDIKAQNVMRDRDRRVVLMDFGAGRDRMQEESDPQVAGTPLYLAPELFAGRPASVQSDIYGAGVLLHHLLSGTYPLAGRTIREVREGHSGGRRRSLRDLRQDVPDALVSVIERALAVEPGARFRSADEMADALRSSAAKAAPSPPSRARLAGGGAAAAALLLGVLFALNVGGVRDRRAGGGGVPGASTSPGAIAAAADRTFAVRQVLKPGEYSELGRPSADGRYFPYIDQDSDLVVKELATGRVIRVTSHGSSAEYVDGAAAMSPDGQQVAHPWGTGDGAFELRVADVEGVGSGQPRVLVRQPGAEFYPVDWSGDSKWILALIERKDLAQQVALVGAEDGSIRPLDGPPPRSQGFSLSPDCRFIAYAMPQADNPRVRDIRVFAVDGSGDWPIVEHPANDLFPLWSPDGGRIFFASDRTGALGLWSVRMGDGRATGDPEAISADMGRMNPLGITRDGAFYFHLRTGLVDAYTIGFDATTGTTTGKPEPVAPNYIGSNISSTWSPDGRRVAYVSIRSVARADRYSRTLSIRDVATGKERDIWPALGFFIMPSWSPDGRTVVVRGNDLSGQCCLQLIDVGSGQVTYVPLDDGLTAGHYQWTPDGRSLVFARRDIITSRDLATGHETELLNVHAAGIDRLTPPPFGRPFEISPDRRFLAFSGWMGQGDAAQTVIEVAPIGGLPVEIARSGSKEPMFFQGWTPDGRDILFTQPDTQKPGMTALWRVSSSGAAPVPVGVEMPRLRDVHINRDASRLTFTAGAETGEVRVMQNFLPAR